MPCPFTGPKMFCAGPNFFNQPKNLVPLQKSLCRHKNQFCLMQIIFLSGTKCLWPPQYLNIFLVWHKKFGPAQNILRPVKGQGKRQLQAIEAALKYCVHQTCRKPPPPKSIHNVRFLKMEKVCRRGLFLWTKWHVEKNGINAKIHWSLK